MIYFVHCNGMKSVLDGVFLGKIEKKKKNLLEFRDETIEETRLVISK